MRFAALFAVAALAALAVQTVATRWLPAMLVPDLVLILAVDLGLRHPSVAAAALAFAMGYATDAFSGSQIGLNALMLTLIFMLAYGLSLQVIVANSLLEASLVFVAAMINGIGALTLSLGMSTLLDADPSVIERIIVQSLLTAALTPAVLSALNRGNRLLGLPPETARE